MTPTDREPALALRLRGARQVAGLTQREVADALGVSIAGVSSWENPRSAKTPEADRLAKYAAHLAPLLGEDAGELTDELLQLRDRAQRGRRRTRITAVRPRPAAEEREGSGGIWEFDTRLPITIVCSRTPDALLSGVCWAHRTHPNYVRLLSLAEADAALSLHSYLKLHNPTVTVNVGTPDELRPDLLTGHVVMLGLQDWSMLGGPMVERLGIPVTVSPPGPIGGPDEFDASLTVTDGDAPRRFAPTLQQVPGEPHPVLIDDVSLFARGPSPLNSAATVTICTGLFNRGTTGLVWATTDRVLAATNHRVLTDRFGRDRAASGPFALIARVNVVDQLTPPLDLSVPGVLEWSWAPV